MTDAAKIARALTKAQREKLSEVVRTNGGGVWVAVEQDADGNFIPLDRTMRALWKRDLIQGKLGGCSRVVHTKLGLAVRAELERMNDD